MQSTRRTRLAAAVLAAALVAGGCHLHHPRPGRGVGPPPHAPAHGYRHHHHGHDLVFDEGLGVYVVVGLPGVYFRDGHFFRHHGGAWQWSEVPGGPWSRVPGRRLPPGLAKKGGPPGQMKRR